MHILILGGTGLLGSAAAEIMLKNGHQVTALSLPPLPKTLQLPDGLNVILQDINMISDQECDHLMKGIDAFVFAAGVDERVDFKPPVKDAYYRYNIVPLQKTLASAKRMGVKKAIVLGSYFTYFAKIWPKLELNKHPYIENRLLQEHISFQFADQAFEVVVLELPYIFGPQRGRRPVWSKFIELFDQPKIIFFPKGGTAMITTYQVGVAIYHAILYGKNTMAYPLGYINMTWYELIKEVIHAMGQRKKIITVGKWMTSLGLRKLQKEYDKKGIEPGLNPKTFAQLMTRKTYINPDLSKDLQIPNDDIYQAIYDSISYAYHIHKHQIDVVDMKVKA